MKKPCFWQGFKDNRQFVLYPIYVPQTFHALSTIGQFKT